MAHAEARKAQELVETILARVDQANADRYARDAAELAALRNLHSRFASAGGTGRAQDAPADTGPIPVKN